LFGDDALAILAEQSEQMSHQLDAQHEALEECLGKLPADQNKLVRAAYAPGVRIDQLAAQQGRSAMALYKTLHRIRLALVECTRAVLAREELG
jgi:RNA polymerase sigma-70 factor (ECF subfamily)